MAATTRQFGVAYAPATLPLAGTETLSIVQSGVTVDTTTQDIADLGGGGSTPTGTGFVHITAGVQDGAAQLVALSGMANLAANSIIGNNTGSSATPIALTAAQSAALLIGDGLTVDLAGFRGVPQNSQSAAYTLVAADSGKHIYHPSTDANARTFTIPANASVAFPVGTSVTFINETSQVVSIAITTDTLVLAATGTTGTRSLAQYGLATAIKVTSTRWFISGSGLT